MKKSLSLLVTLLCIGAHAQNTCTVQDYEAHGVVVESSCNGKKLFVQANEDGTKKVFVIEGTTLQPVLAKDIEQLVPVSSKNTDAMDFDLECLSVDENCGEYDEFNALALSEVIDNIQAFNSIESQQVALCADSVAVDPVVVPPQVDPIDPGDQVVVPPQVDPGDQVIVVPPPVDPVDPGQIIDEIELIRAECEAKYENTQKRKESKIEKCIKKRLKKASQKKDKGGKDKGGKDKGGKDKGGKDKGGKDKGGKDKGGKDKGGKDKGGKDKGGKDKGGKEDCLPPVVNVPSTPGDQVVVTPPTQVVDPVQPAPTWEDVLEAQTHEAQVHCEKKFEDTQKRKDQKIQSCINKFLKKAKKEFK